MLYKIVKFVNDVAGQTISTNLSVQQARKIVSLDNTHKIDEKGNILWYYSVEEQVEEAFV